MSQRKWIPAIVGLILIVAILTPVMSTGFTDLHKADSAFGAQDFSTASAYYLRAARVLFWRRDLIEKAGIASARSGDFEAATKLLNSAPRLTGEGWVWLCASQVQLGRLDDAIPSCNAGIREHESASLYRLLAMAYRDQGNMGAEQSALQNQLRLDSSDAYAHYRLGLLLTLSAPEQALDELNLAASLDPETASAVQTMSAALSLSATQAEASYAKVTIGRALALVNEWELAASAFEQATQINEKNAEAWAWLGEAYQQLGQDGRAALDQALRIDHTSVNVRALRALYWTRQKKYQQALAEYLLAAEFDPQNPRWQMSLGETYAITGDLVSALTAFQRAVELAPADPMYWRALAMFCAEKGVHLEEIGMPAAQQAISLSPDDPQSLDVLGFVYFSTGRFANAEQTLMQAIEKDSAYYPAHIHLALNYLAQGRRAEAFNALTLVRDTDTSGIYSETAAQLQIGRASCRERVCLYV